MANARFSSPGMSPAAAPLDHLAQVTQAHLVELPETIETLTNAVEVQTVGAHSVERVRNRANGIVVHEEWDMEDGKLDRSDGPAVIQRDPNTGVAIYEGWSKNGKADRRDGPADIRRDPNTGVAVSEEWKKDGRLDRADGPAVIQRDAATGVITTQEWRRDGHHVGRANGGPDSISRDPITAIVTYEAWHNDNGKPDRANGPARIIRDAKTGVVTDEMWWHDGKCNDRIQRDAATGKITFEKKGGKVIVNTHAGATSEGPSTARSSAPHI